MSVPGAGEEIQGQALRPGDDSETNEINQFRGHQPRLRDEIAYCVAVLNAGRRAAKAHDERIADPTASCKPLKYDANL